MEYEIYFKPSALRDIQRIPYSAWKSLEKEIERLATNPFMLKSNKIYRHRSRHYHKIVFGQYYIIYKVSTVEKALQVLKIARNREF